MGSGRAFESLTLLFAICEQTLLDLDAADPSDAQTVTAVTALRDHVATVLPHYSGMPAV